MYNTLTDCSRVSQTLTNHSSNMTGVVVVAHTIPPAISTYLGHSLVGFGIVEGTPESDGTIGTGGSVLG